MRRSTLHRAYLTSSTSSSPIFFLRVSIETLDTARGTSRDATWLIARTVRACTPDPLTTPAGELRHARIRYSFTGAPSVSSPSSYDGQRAPRTFLEAVRTNTVGLRYGIAANLASGLPSRTSYPAGTRGALASVEQVSPHSAERCTNPSTHR